MTPTLGSRVDLFGVRYTVTDYEHATAEIRAAANERRSFAFSALAVHGLIEATLDESFAAKVNSIDLVAPDGQPVRWAMNAVHDAGLSDRVYGPDLTWHAIQAVVADDVPIFLFGSTEETCLAFKENIEKRFPGAVVHYQSDRFRDPTLDEDAADIETINGTGAGLILVGRGCPRQEHWVADHRGKVHGAMLAVGAAFDYGAESLTPPPAWMQRIGLQWLFRLAQDPKRLWKRYLVTNSLFLCKFAVALVRKRFATRD